MQQAVCVIGHQDSVAESSGNDLRATFCARCPQLDLLEDHARTGDCGLTERRFAAHRIHAVKEIHERIRINNGEFASHETSA